MKKKQLSIDDLLNALKTTSVPEKKKLENTFDTWSRIGARDSFTDLGIKESELDKFLSDWIKDNPYENIK